MIKKSIRCCISCILPCGALDVIRIVHANGRVEEISGIVRAAEVMKAHPKHVLKKPTSRPYSSDDAVSPQPTIVVVPPDAELQRGKIYFLIPVGPSPGDPNKIRNKSKSDKKLSKMKTERGGSGRNNSISVRANLVFSGDRYLSEILSEKISTVRERRRGRVGVWRPHLESISETISEAASSCD